MPPRQVRRGRNPDAVLLVAAAAGIAAGGIYGVVGGGLGLAGVGHPSRAATGALCGCGNEFLVRRERSFHRLQEHQPGAVEMC